MSDFTPSLDEVRAIYTSGTPAHHVSIAGAYAEFDRAIAKVRADAWQEGWNAGAGWPQDDTNPYRADQ